MQAAAFVEVFVGASACGCDVGDYVEALDFEDIWAEASASAYAAACVSATPSTASPPSSLASCCVMDQIECLCTCDSSCGIDTTYTFIRLCGHG